MIGTTLYKARVKDGRVELESKTIVSTKRVFHYFDEQEHKGCRKADVGLTIFLTPNEAVDYLIAKLEDSIEMGEAYVAKERQQLSDAMAFKFPGDRKTASMNDNETE